MPTIWSDLPSPLMSRSAAEAPWGAPRPSFQPASPEAAARRAEAVAKLVAAVKALVETAHEAMFAGAFTPDEYANLANLQLWLGALLAEQEGAGKRKAPGKPRRK